MRRTFVCKVCHSAGVWGIRSVMEHGPGGQAAYFGVAHEAAPFETYICKVCGYTEWYSRAGRQLRADPLRAVVDVNDWRLECDKCEGRREHHLIARVEEFGPILTFVDGRLSASTPLRVLPPGTDGKRGSFAALVCGDCGFTQWFSCELDLSALEPGPMVQPGTCKRCHVTQLRRVGPLYEADGYLFPVVLRNGAERGAFEIVLCEGCGFTEWYAQGLNDLRADGEQVLSLEPHGAEPRPEKNAGGPYR